MTRETEQAWRLIDQVTHVTAIALLWLIASLPVVTLGAASVAAASVIVARRREGERAIVGPFVTACRRRWRPATLIWLAGLVLLALFAVDLGYYVVAQGARGFALASGVLVGLAFLVTLLLVGLAWFVLAGRPDVTRVAPALRQALALARTAWPWVALTLLPTLGLPAFLVATHLWQFTPVLGGVIVYANTRLLLRGAG